MAKQVTVDLDWLYDLSDRLDNALDSVKFGKGDGLAEIDAISLDIWKVANAH